VHCTLKQFGFGIGSKLVDDIVAILSHRRLLRLNVNKNCLETKDAIKIAKRCSGSKYLSEFIISSNCIGIEAADSIANILSCSRNF